MNSHCTKLVRKVVMKIFLSLYLQLQHERYFYSNRLKVNRLNRRKAEENRNLNFDICWLSNSPVKVNRLNRLKVNYQANAAWFTSTRDMGDRGIFEDKSWTWIYENGSPMFGKCLYLYFGSESWHMYICIYDTPNFISFQHSMQFFKFQIFPENLTSIYQNTHPWYEALLNADIYLSS